MCSREDDPTQHEVSRVRLMVTKSPFQYGGETLLLDATGCYHDGPMAVRIVDATGAPYAVLSVNLPQSKALPEGHFALKNWSENKDLAAAVEKAGLIEAANPFIHEPIHSGFVVAPIYRLKGAPIR